MGLLYKNNPIVLILQILLNKEIDYTYLMMPCALKILVKA